ncbi:MAG: MarR family [Thermoleophilia bacterium]|nr:MarR family [Thermoleophilia bacterium]
MSWTFDELVAVQRHITAWRRLHTLTANEAAVLLEVHAAGAIGAAALSRMVGISTASMSRMLSRLETTGWIVRSGDADDGRRLLVQPSKQLAAAAAELAQPGRPRQAVVREA